MEAEQRTGQRTGRGTGQETGQRIGEDRTGAVPAWSPLYGGHKEAVRGPSVVHSRVHLGNRVERTEERTEHRTEDRREDRTKDRAEDRTRDRTEDRTGQDRSSTCLVSHPMAAMRDYLWPSSGP